MDKKYKDFKKNYSKNINIHFFRHNKENYILK